MLVARQDEIESLQITAPDRSTHHADVRPAGGLVFLGQVLR